MPYEYGLNYEVSFTPNTGSGAVAFEFAVRDVKFGDVAPTVIKQVNQGSTLVGKVASTVLDPGSFTVTAEFDGSDEPPAKGTRGTLVVTHSTGAVWTCVDAILMSYSPSVSYEQDGSVDAAFELAQEWVIT